MTIKQIAPGVRYAERRDWGADAKLPRQGQMVPRANRNRVFAHHTVMPDRDASPNLWESDAEVFASMRTLQRARPDLGADIPYSFVMFLMADGSLLVCEGRGEDRSGAHTKGFNTSAIGISFAGDFHNRDTPGLAGFMPHVSAFLAWLHKDVGMFNLRNVKPGGGRSIFFHRDISATACPGDHLVAALKSVAF